MPRVSLFIVSILPAVLLAPGAYRSAKAEDLTALAIRVKPSVVHITVHDATGQEKATGTGFFISEDGLIVTNEHVIEKASQVRATLLDGRVVAVVGALARDPNRDVAILQAEGRDYPPLAFDERGDVPVGTKVAVIGSPLALTWTLSEGIVSAQRKETELPAQLRGGKASAGVLLQITAAISPGSSGSPVLDSETGRVVGVAVSTVIGGADLHFAVPIAAVQDLLLSIGPETQAQSFSALPLRNLIISAVFFALLAAGYAGFRRYGSARTTRGS